MNKIRNIQARTHAAMLSRGTRGTNMLEYALMAAVVVGLAVILISPLRTKFNELRTAILDFNKDSSAS
jgi:hypothetical protein